MLIALVLIYVLGFLFCLGFWLEESNGENGLWEPVALAFFWPLVALAGVFGLGCQAGKEERRRSS